MKHICKEGSREHVVSYYLINGKVIMKCSEPNCCINKGWKERVDDNY